MDEENATLGAVVPADHQMGLTLEQATAKMLADKVKDTAEEEDAQGPREPAKPPAFDQEEDMGEDDEILMMQALDERQQQPEPEPKKPKSRKREAQSPREPAVVKRAAVPGTSVAIATQPFADDRSAAGNSHTGSAASAGRGVHVHQAKASEAPIRKTWVHCRVFAQEEDVFTMPASFATAKDAQKAKWKTEASKLSVPLATLARILSSDPSTRVTDQHIKSSLTALKKVKGSVDKKLGYTTAENSNPLFSSRANSMASALEAAKSLRSMSTSCQKTGKIPEKQLETSIRNVQDPLSKLLGGEFGGLPVHWVQARQFELLIRLVTGP